MARGKTSKRSKATVIGAGAILAAGIYLGSQFRGIGAGGDGVGAGRPGEAETVVSAMPVPGAEPDLELPPQTEPGFESDPPMSDGGSSGAPRMVAVLVGEGQYLISIDGQPAQRATLEEIAEFARKTTGTEEGLRVQIRYDESARGVDDERLKAQLASADIASSAIQVVVPE